MRENTASVFLAFFQGVVLCSLYTVFTDSAYSRRVFLRNTWYILLTVYVNTNTTGAMPTTPNKEFAGSAGGVWFSRSEPRRTRDCSTTQTHRIAPLPL